jgi:hypothetical protein
MVCDDTCCGLSDYAALTVLCGLTRIRPRTPRISRQEALAARHEQCRRRLPLREWNRADAGPKPSVTVAWKEPPSTSSRMTSVNSAIAVSQTPLSSAGHNNQASLFEGLEDLFGTSLPARSLLRGLVLKILQATASCTPLSASVRSKKHPRCQLPKVNTRWRNQGESSHEKRGSLCCVFFRSRDATKRVAVSVVSGQAVVSVAV